MKKGILLLICAFSLQAQAQLLFLDSFLYTPGPVLGGTNGWTQSSAVSVGATAINGNGLIYPNYSNALSGCAEIFHNGGVGDIVYHALSTPQSGGSVYASFVINVTTLPTTQNNPYCITLGNQQNFAYGLRLLVKQGSSPNFVRFGTRKANNSADVWSTIDCPLQQSHLLVMKYKYNTGSATDDEVKLFVNPLTANEPTVASADASTGTDFTDTLKQFIIRNNGGTNIPSAKIDEIHVGKSWSDIFNIVVIPASITDINLFNFSVYPNPTNGNITLTSDVKNISNCFTTIVNQQGAIVYKDNMNKTVNMQQLPSGIYFLSVTENNKIIYKQSIQKN